jgi:hypothetical protein
MTQELVRWRQIKCDCDEGDNDDNRKQTGQIRKPAKKSATGIKALIMAASLAITIGGWGVLAVGQSQNMLTSAQQSPAISSTSRSPNPSTRQSQFASPNTQPSAIARTRSSR